jgi:hypothetical protein
MTILALSRAVQQRVEVITVAAVIFLLVFELVRRKHLMERYAILWLTAAATVLVLSVWTGLLAKLAHAAGIAYLPSALFAVAFLFVLVMLVHFSMTISRLAHQNTVLAQRLALLQQRFELPDLERESDRATAASSATPQLGGQRREVDR